MVRFAVIGTNFITDNFMNAGSQCEGFKVQAVYSRSMEKAKEYAEKYGIEDCYDSLDALAAAKDIDAVYVASPNALHAGQSIRSGAPCSSTASIPAGMTILKKES